MFYHLKAHGPSVRPSRGAGDVRPQGGRGGGRGETAVTWERAHEAVSGRTILRFPHTRGVGRLHCHACALLVS